MTRVRRCAGAGWRAAIVFALALAALGRASAQVRSGTADTLPPGYARGTRPDTAPGDKEKIDLVARTAKLPLLRARPPGARRKELRLWWDGGMAIPMNLIRITVDGTIVRGELILWVTETIPDRGINPPWRAFVDSLPGLLQARFRCPRVITDTLQFSAAQQGYRHELVAVCRTRFRREPDWRDLLRALEAHHVWTLPDASELPTLRNVVSLDGYRITVEAWDGVRYRTYSFSNPEVIPAPEAKELAAIHGALLAFLTRSHESQR